MKAMTMFTAQVAGQQNNAQLPEPAHRIHAADLEAVARFDWHVVAEYVGGRRSASSFVASNRLVMDVDNSHTEERAEWVNPASLEERLADVALMTATPQPPKGERSPVGQATFHRLLPDRPCG